MPRIEKRTQQKNKSISVNAILRKAPRLWAQRNEDVEIWMLFCCGCSNWQKSHIWCVCTFKYLDWNQNQCSAAASNHFRGRIDKIHRIHFNSMSFEFAQSAFLTLNFHVSFSLRRFSFSTKKIEFETYSTFQRNMFHYNKREKKNNDGIIWKIPGCEKQKNFCLFHFEFRWIKLSFKM